MRLYDGVDGHEIRTLWAPIENAPFGETRNLEPIGDMTGDGVGELAVGLFHEFGEVIIFDPTTGATLRSHPVGLFEGEITGAEIASLGDLDGDAVTDYAILTEGESAGAIEVFSGASGSEIATIVHYSAYIPSIGGAGDLNGDGVVDLALGLWDERALELGEVCVLSGQILLTDQQPTSLNFPVRMGMPRPSGHASVRAWKILC